MDGDIKYRKCIGKKQLGAGYMVLGIWSWDYEAEHMELSISSWVYGAGYMELGVWSWSSVRLYNVKPSVYV